MGEGLSTTYPPKSKSKFQIRIEVADRDCGVRGLSPVLFRGAPLFRRCKSPALIQKAEGLPASPLPSCGPFPARSWKKCRPEPFPRSRSALPRSRSGPFFGPFSPFPCPFPLLLPVSSALVGRVRALILCR